VDNNGQERTRTLGATAGRSTSSSLTSGGGTGEVEFESPTQLPRALRALACVAVSHRGRASPTAAGLPSRSATCAGAGGARATGTLPAGAAVVAAVLWLALSLFLGFRSLSRQVEGFQRVPIPGQAEVSFAEPGGYTVYFEGVGASDDQVALPPFRFSLTTVGGEEVTVRPYGGLATYGLAGHSGRAVARRTRR
jgi:hypothetical protein